MTDWSTLTARAGRAGHDLVGWLMWDPDAIASYADLGVPNGAGWIQAWRLAPLGNISAGAAAAATYSIQIPILEFIFEMQEYAPSLDAILDVRDAAIEPGLEAIAPGLCTDLGPLADDLWRGVDSCHHGARILFGATKAQPRPEQQPVLSAWLASNCLRELRGDNHWALCAAAGLAGRGGGRHHTPQGAKKPGPGGAAAPLAAVEGALLHSAMVDIDEYESEEWIARSRGADDDAVARGWGRLEAKGYANGAALTDAGRAFRADLERRTDDLTAPAWQAVGEDATRRFCDVVERHHEAFLARIDATAGPRWMPALRSTS